MILGNWMEILYCFFFNFLKLLFNLIKFILVYVKRDFKIDIVVDICSKTCVNYNRRRVVYVMTYFRVKRRNIKRRISFLFNRRAYGKFVLKEVLRFLWRIYRIV